ncbi:MAG: ABC transporter permease subunit [Deinococcota bacterium]
MTAERARVGLGASLGILLLLGLWTWLASGEPELIFPSPPETWAALSSLARSGKLVSASLITLGRAAGAVLLALAVGLIWGTLNGLSKWAKAVSAPLLGALMALPPIVLVILGITWLGPSGQTAQLVVFWVAIPLIVVATAEAVSAVDRDLLEMAAAFKLGRVATLRHVIIPAVASPLLAAVSVALGQSLRVAVMGELLSATSGVGAEVARARANVATADVFAWALVLVAVVLTVELVLLRPLAGRVLGWRNRACERR